MPKRNKKLLVIPIISPIRKKSDNQIKYNYNIYESGKEKPRGKNTKTLDDRYNLRDFYVCARSLNNLKLSLKDANYAFVAPALTCGEGNRMQLGIWKSLINLTIDIFESEKVIPGVMFQDIKECLSAIRYLIGLGNVKRIFLTPIHAIGFEEYFNIIYNEFEKDFIAKKIKIWIYLPYKKEYNDEIIDNMVVLIAAKKYRNIIEAIKDSRVNTNVNYINELMLRLEEANLKIKVLQGWERMYLKTNETVSGGVFPLAVIEPEIIQSFINYEDYLSDVHGETDEILDMLIKKYCLTYDWIWRIKKEFISRPFDIQYDERDFSMAFDKFFEVYSEEKIENFHVLKFDIKNPLTSILRTLVSDLISLQTTYFRYHKLSNIYNTRLKHKSSKEAKELLFIPVAVRITNITDGSYSELLVKYKPKQNAKKSNSKSKKYARLSGNWIVDFKDMNNEFFRNNYDIEKKILMSSVLTHLQYGDNEKGEKFEDKQPKNDQALPEFTPDGLGFDPKLRPAIKIAPPYTYISEDQKDQFDVNIAYVINPKDVHSVPDSLFTNLTRIAIFTKRNRLATDEIERHSIKSAIAAVMSRNISHNIGSHVLVKLSEQKNVTVSEEVSRLNQYLKHRMSFIADLSTAQAVASHTNELKSEIISNFTKTKLLINYISGNDNISGRNIDIQVYNNLSGANDALLVDLPNDIIGRHAIYTILENYIRNSAKYSVIPTAKPATPSDPGVNKLKISIFISEPEKRSDIYYQVDIVDNLGHANNKARCALENVKEEAGKKGRASFKLLNILQDSIDKPILQSGKVRVGGWGILEMKICAAFLRKYDLENIDDATSDNEEQLAEPFLLKCNYYDVNETSDGKSSFSVVEADAYTEGKEKPDLQLGYQFYLLKPKTILIVFDSRPDLATDGLIGFYSKIGIDIWFQAEKNYEEDILRGTSHKLLVLAGNRLQQMNRICQSNQRKLWLTDLNTRDAWTCLLEKDGKNVEVFFWTEYINSRKMQAGIHILRHGANFKEPVPEPRNAYFDDHGGTMHFLQQCEKNGFYYYEPFTSQTGTNTFLSRYDGNYNDPLLRLKLQEVAGIQIVVIDERIQRSMNEMIDFKQIRPIENQETSIEQLSLREILNSMGIIVPEKTGSAFAIDLDRQNFNKEFDTDYNNLCKWLINTCEEQKRIKFVIIHLNIIEKMKGSEPDVIADVYKHWQEMLGSEVSVVFVSGRGEPSTIPEGSLFMPYDCLEEYLIRFRSKSSLIDLLFGLRRKQKRNR